MTNWWLPTSRNITIVVPIAAGTGMDLLVRLYAEQLSHALGICQRIITVAEAEFAACRHIAELVGGSGIGARSAERCEIGDDGIGRIHHAFAALEDVERDLAR